MSLALDRQPLRLHRLSFLFDGDAYVIGRMDIDSYGVFPPDGAALLQELQAGRTLGEAADWYAATYGEGVDIEEFVDTLSELRFVRQDDAEAAADLSDGQTVRWQRLGKAVFSPAAWACYLVLVAGAVVACVADPRLAPRNANVFFTEYRTVIELTIFFGQIPLTLLHELFHVLAGRRLGLRSKLRLSQRLHFVVFETVLDGLVAVPRKKRYLPMLAGMVADIVVMAGLTLCAAASRLPSGRLSLFGGVCLALAFTTLLRIAWQFYFYLRTDVYYLITTLFGCVDLQTTTREFLHNRVNRVLGRTGRLADESRWHPRDRRVARWYAPLVVVGYAVSIALLLLVFLPLTYRFFGGAIRAVFFDGARDSAELLDSAAVLILALGQLVLAGVLALRERHRRKTRLGPEHAEGDRQ